MGSADQERSRAEVLPQVQEPVLEHSPPKGAKEEGLGLQEVIYLDLKRVRNLVEFGNPDVPFTSNDPA